MLLNESEDPKVMLSSTDKVEPKRAMPNSENDEPHRA
jgi:hypothetical protein